MNELVWQGFSENKSQNFKRKLKTVKFYLLSSVLDKSIKLNFGSEEVKQGRLIVDINLDNSLFSFFLI